MSIVAGDAPQLKKFSFAEIERRTLERRNIPTYRQVLFDCKVGEDEDGVIFNMRHPSWAKLIKLVSNSPPLPPPSPKEKATDAKPAANSKPANTNTGAASNNIAAVQFRTRRRGNSEIGVKAAASALENLLRAPTDDERESKKALLPNVCQQLRDLISRDAEQGDEFEMAKELVLFLCKFGDGIPDDLRGIVWRYLLLTSNNTSGAASSESNSGGSNVDFAYSDLFPAQVPAASCQSSSQPSSGPHSAVTAIDVDFDLPNQKVIRSDIDRTRPHVPEFQSDEVKMQMEMILTAYCQNHHLSYKQGMNYVLAPFFLIQLDIDTIYRCYESFLTRYMASTFADDEFGALQCCFRLFRLLLLYHDPELCSFLDQYDMAPELYASQWFLTFFSNRCPIPELMFVFDFLIASDDVLMIFHVCVSLLISKRDLLFSQSPVTLPETLTRICIASKSETRALFLAARSLQANTPLSFSHLEMHVAKTPFVRLDSDLYTRCRTMQALSVAPAELIGHCFQTDQSAEQRAFTQLKFFILDCRPAEQYAAGHLPCAYSLDANLLSAHPEQLAQHIHTLQSLKGCHFCLFDESDTEKDRLNSLVLYLLSKGFKYISVCEGGYAQTHSLIMNHDQNERETVEIIDHDASLCHVCSPPPPKPTTEAPGFLSSWINSSRLSSIAQRFGGLGALIDEPEAVAVSSAMQSAAPGITMSALPVDSGMAMTLPASHAQTPEVRLLLTVMRSKTSTAQAFTASAIRLFAMLVGRLLERDDTCAQFEKIVQTPNDGHYSGHYVARSLMLLPIEGCHSITQKVFEPFMSVMNLTFGKIVPIGSSYSPAADEQSWTASQTSECTLILPRAFCADDGGSASRLQLGEQQVVFVVPSINKEADVRSMIGEVLKHGVCSDNVTILCLVCSRPALRVLKDEFTGLSIIAAAVDECVNGKLLPGFGAFEQRFVQ